MKYSFRLTVSFLVKKALHFKMETEQHFQVFILQELHTLKVIQLVSYCIQLCTITESLSVGCRVSIDTATNCLLLYIVYK